MGTRTWAVLAAAALLAAPAAGQWYVAGDFNGWNPAGDAMTEIEPGIWSVTLSMEPGRHEFKVTTGAWPPDGEDWPHSGNSWLFTDADGNITITLDTNVYDDGWFGTTRRLGLDVDPGMWTAVGDWQGWDPGNPATAMTPMGNGVYFLEAVIDTPGEHFYKAVVTGSWDAIGADARSVNADSIAFTTDEVNNVARFWVDALAGIARVEVVPEPAAGGLLALGLVLLRRRA